MAQSIKNVVVIGVSLHSQFGVPSQTSGALLPAFLQRTVSFPQSFIISFFVVFPPQKRSEVAKRSDHHLLSAFSRTARSLIYQAGGNLGPFILSALQKANTAFNISILARQSSTSNFPAGVPVHRTDYSKESLLAIFKDQDAVVSTIATDSLAVQQTIIDAAAEAGVKRFIPSEYGLDTSNPIASDYIPGTKLKQDVHARLRAKESMGMSWTAIIVGLWFDWGMASGFMSWDISNRKVVTYNTGDEHFFGANLARIAEGVVKTLQRPEETKNQFVYVWSHRTTQNEVLAVLKEITGDEWEIERAKTEDATAKGKRLLQEGDGLFGLVNTVLGALFGVPSLSDFKEQAEYWSEKLDLPEEDLEETLRRVVKEVEAKKG